MKSVTAILILLFLSTPMHSALAKGWSIGGGGQFVSFNDDLDGVDSGFGAIFNANYMLNTQFGFDFQFGLSGHEEDVANKDAGYAYNMTGIRFLIATGEFSPYVTAGISLNKVGFEEFDTISGEGIYWGLGADIQLAPRHSINISYRFSEWNGEDEDFDYDISNTYFSVAYNFHFTP